MMDGVHHFCVLKNLLHNKHNNNNYLHGYKNTLYKHDFEDSSYNAFVHKS